MKIVDRNLETEIVEKKSKFIANIFYINNVEEAENRLKEIKKKYHNAKHNCFCYRVIENNNLIEKCSDDGEPSGTAGQPMLDILRGQELCNTIVIVTRYFGGILLGTGGLVRAYSEATKKSIEENSLLEVEDGFEFEVFLDYKSLLSFEYYCRKNNINILKKEYGENIKIIVEINKEKKDEICNNSGKNELKIIESRILSKKLIRKFR